MARDGSRLTGEWGKAERFNKTVHNRLKKNLALATKRNASGLRDAIKRTLTTGLPSWPPLSGLTTKAKKSSKPLMDYGDLRDAVSYKVVTPTTFFVGVARSAGRKDRTPFVSIAAVHEYGATIKPRKRRALAIPVSRKASELAKQNRGVRNIPKLFRPKGTSVLALPKGKGFEIMFILRKQSVIPPRPFVAPTAQLYRPKMAGRWKGAIKATIRGNRYA